MNVEIDEKDIVTAANKLREFFGDSKENGYNAAQVLCTLMYDNDEFKEVDMGIEVHKAAFKMDPDQFRIGFFRGLQTFIGLATMRRHSPDNFKRGD